MTTLINGIPATPEQEKEMERESIEKSNNIKTLYSQMFRLGCKDTQQVCSKLQRLSMFFGHIEAIGDMTDVELRLVHDFLTSLENENYKFN